MASRNCSRVPQKQWRRWSGKARSVFNEVYKFMMNNPELMRHPKQLTPDPSHWKTTAWNAAWIAADAVDDAIPTEFREVA